MGKERLFGTDGIRGHIDSLRLQPENMVKLGRIVGYLAKKSSHRPVITIGRDTRASGIYLEHALIAGISSVGIDCHLVGIMPTALMAHCAKLNQSAFGIMISASHNPYHDNGIKLFDGSGFKIDEDTEQLIEQIYFESHHIPTAEMPGKIIHHEQAEKSYLSMLGSAFGADFSLHGLKVVVDCAHGAASSLASPLLSSFGVHLTLLGNSPDGLNINRGFGSEAPDQLRAEVKKHNADLGIAFDGDADRVVFIDEQGEIIDGDAVLALMAIYAKKSGRLHKNTVVATIMSSVALDKTLAPYDIRVVRTNVGDKLVAHKMTEEALSFGGENSGHLLFFPYSTTGDGIFSALEFLRILKLSLLPASKLKEIFQPTPKLLKNIKVNHKIPLHELPKTQQAIEQANASLNGAGRVMFRYSGTEDKARLLVEASSQEECQQIALAIAYQFSTESGQNSENCTI